MIQANVRPLSGSVDRGQIKRWARRSTLRYRIVIVLQGTASTVSKHKMWQSYGIFSNTHLFLISFYFLD